MDRKLFGTDGIRGIANQEPMTAELALGLGRAAARLFAEETGRPRLVIGMDTRLSGDMLALALAAGMCSAGADPVWVGVLPTAGVAHAVRAAKAAAGFVVSASHNPYEDNGIKVFGADGFKLDDALEARLESLLADGETAARCLKIRETGRVERDEHAAERYVEFLKSGLRNGNGPPPAFTGMKIVLDCANGAAYRVAPALFRELGAETTAIGDAPDGKNINDACGSQHPEALVRWVLASGAHIGLAFDGDADRLIAVDETGDVLSGDRILAVCAKHLKSAGRLPGDTVVSTVMSNLGLGEALKEMGLRHIQAQVGDRYVMQAMRASGAALGGEDSGHIIFADHHTTGDGLLSALKLLEAVKESGAPLSELKSIMKVYPQFLVNVAVKSRPDFDQVPEIAGAISEAEKNLGASGRVLVRYSGTQLLCRVMVEGPTMEKTREECQRIAAVIARVLG
jgi:phosphoglucosamine mutase